MAMRIPAKGRGFSGKATTTGGRTPALEPEAVLIGDVCGARRSCLHRAAAAGVPPSRDTARLPMPESGGQTWLRPFALAA